MKALRWSWVMVALVRSDRRKRRIAGGKRGADFRKEGGERLGAVMNMGRKLGPARHRLVLGVRRHAVHQDRGHPNRMRGLEIVRQVVEHGGLARCDGMGADEALIGFAHRLRMEVPQRMNIEDVGEQAAYAEPLDHGFRMLARAVGEDEPAPRQPGERRGKFGRGVNRTQIDVVHIVEEIVGRHVMQAHQPRERGAVLVVIGFGQALRLVQRDAEAIGDELAHAPVDLREQIAVGRVERVVEIEHLGLDVIEAACQSAAIRHCVPPAAPFRRRRSIRVPAPCSVKSSSSTACGTLPFMMTTPSTPSAMRSRQLSIFGIMPPEIVPSSIRLCASAVVSDLIRLPFLSSTPSTSVSRRRRFALSAEASAAAKVSALMLRVSPSGPTPIGATTGIKSDWMMTSMICGSTAAGSPTKPRSAICSILEVGSRQRRSSRLARIRFASLPEMPTALPP